MNNKKDKDVNNALTDWRVMLQNGKCLVRHMVRYD